jgi:hypothetical protein
MRALCRIDALETRQNVSWIRCIGPEDGRELGEAMRGIRQEAAGVRENDAGARISVNDTVQHELDSRSCRVERIVDKRTSDAIRGPKGWLSGMHEYDGSATVEFSPERLEYRLAQISSSIVGEEDHPIGSQRVQRIFEFPRAPSTSGTGSVAKLPNRSGRIATRSAAYSLTRRAIFRRSLLSQRATLGAVSERIPVAISWESMKSMALSADHWGITVPEGSPP